jgi:hypothetical protein
MANYRALARQIAQRHGLDPGVFERQINQESGFNPTARSPAGALGIAQIMPATARGWGVDPLNARQALDAAAKNMASYVRQYGGYENALRAYNAGPGAIQKSKGFAETNNYVRTILGGHTPSAPSGGGASPRRGGGGGGGGGTSTTRTTTETTPGTDNRIARYNLVQSFLEDQGADPVSFATGINALKDIPGTTTTNTVRTGGGTGGGDGGGAIAGAGGLAATAARRATAIDRQRLPYKWGGGHGGQTKITDPVPLDCSGAVSKVLGIDPRVADQFKTWGRPGDGGSKGVTVYSKPTHTLMKINGHLFGTSGSNPGGGAGWIPETAVSKDYLAGFTARHSSR